MAPVRTLLNRTGRARATPAGERLGARAIFAPGSTGSFGDRFLSPESLRTARRPRGRATSRGPDPRSAPHQPAPRKLRPPGRCSLRRHPCTGGIEPYAWRGHAGLPGVERHRDHYRRRYDAPRLRARPLQVAPARPGHPGARRRYRVDRVREHRAIELLAAEASQTRPCSSIPFGPTHVKVPGKPSVGPNGAAQASVRGPTGG
jgi:hypothetical protein